MTNCESSANGPQFRHQRLGRAIKQDIDQRFSLSLRLLDKVETEGERQAPRLVVPDDVVTDKKPVKALVQPLQSCGNTRFCCKHVKSFLEVVSKPSIGFNVKAKRGVQPQEYIEYFEDWTPRPNTKSNDLDPRGGFENTSNL
jgi:hypothetical protein